LGFSITENGGAPLYTLAFDEKHIGNPAIRALHGGVIATFLEFSAQCALLEDLPDGATVNTVNIDIDYMASARAEDMKARVKILRAGRRLAFVEATGWQHDETRPVATARMRFRIDNKTNV